MSVSVEYPSISVIVPSFNQGQYIEETILSIVGQQYPNLELIVIDGGSTDNTVQILENYSNKISYWHSKKDQGQADAINQGMKLSSGEIVCWLNSDDMYLPGTLLDIGRRFSHCAKENHLIYGATVTINQENPQNLSSSAQAASNFNEFDLTCFDFIVQPSTFWTRSLWQTVGELNTHYNYVLDWDWFIRASKITQFEYVSKFYSVYRYHPLHKTRNGGADRRQEILNVVKQYSSEYWADLYTEVENSYSKLIEYINYWKIPKRNLWLPIFFPKVASKLNKIQDLYTVLTMYG